MPGNEYDLLDSGPTMCTFASRLVPAPMAKLPDFTFHIVLKEQTGNRHLGELAAASRKSHTATLKRWSNQSPSFRLISGELKRPTRQGMGTVRELIGSARQRRLYQLSFVLPVWLSIVVRKEGQLTTAGDPEGRFDALSVVGWRNNCKEHRNEFGHCQEVMFLVSNTNSGGPK